MDRLPPDRKKRQLRFAEPSLYVEAYDEAVDLYLERDYQAWGELLTFHKRFLSRAWEKPLVDGSSGIDG